MPLLLGFVAVPACFYGLPPQEALDRWNIATAFVFVAAVPVAILQLARGGRPTIALLAAISVVAGALLANVGLGSLDPISGRRYCEAQQMYARTTLREAAGGEGVSAESCSASAPGVSAAFQGSQAARFKFRVEPVANDCVFSAIGEGYQAGCDTILTVQSDGKQRWDVPAACRDKCD